MFIEKLSIVQLILFLLFINQVYISHEALRISGGFHSASIYLTKYIISFRSNSFKEALYFGSAHYCGGTIISARYILTAAHCMVGTVSDTINVVSGTPQRVQLTNRTQIRKIDKYVVHPNFITDTLKYDIALVKLKVPFNIDTKYTDMVKLSTESHQCAYITAGWGKMYEDGPLPNEILYATVETYSFNQCKPTFNLANVMSFCAGSSHDIQAYIGDSGGPLFCKNYLVGVVSFGYEKIHGLSVYTNVSYFKNWIEENSDAKFEDVNVNNDNTAKSEARNVAPINCELPITSILHLHALAILTFTSITCQIEFII